MPTGSATRAAFTSSGTASVVTVSDTAVTAIATPGAAFFIKSVMFVNGSVAAQFSLDGGTTWHALAASTTLTFSDLYILNTAVMVRRVPGGTNIASLYVYTW